MSKKIVLQFVAVLVIATLILTACAPAATPTQAPAQEQPTTKTEATQAPAEPTKAEEKPAEPTKAEEKPATPAEGTTKPSGNLLIWVQKANQDVFEKTVLPDFQKEYPDIKIEWVNYPPAEVANQMGLAIQGGSGGPDLGITENASIGRLVELDGLMDLTPKLEPYVAQLNEFALKEGSKEGKYYCTPWDIGPVVTFYRRDIFKAAGLSDDPEEVSKMVATWDSYLQTCKTIKDKTGLPCFALNKANNYGDYFFNMTWEQGLDLYKDGKLLIDQPQYAETLNKLGEFWKADVVTDTLEWTDNWYAEMNAKIDDPNVKPVATTVIAAWMGNFLKTWIAADQKGNWGVALMPAFTEGGTRSANQGGSCAFIPAKSTNPDAAWAFIEFMLLNKANHVKIFEYSDYFPAYQATYDDPLFTQPDEYFGGQVTRTLFADVAKQIPVANQYGPLSQTVRGAVTTAIQKFAMGQMSAEDALKEAANTIRTETNLK